MIDDRLRIQQVAQRLRVSPQTVRKLVELGDLPAVTVNGERRFHESDVERYRARQENWLTAAQVAERLGMSPGGVRLLMHENKLKGYELAGRKRDRYRFKRSDVDRLVQARRP